jgi:integrase
MTATATVYKGHTLSPRKDRDGVQVYFGRGPTGRRNVRLFAGEALARKAIDEHLRQIELVGKRARTLTPDQLVDAARALDMLGGKATLQAAAAHYLAANANDAPRATVQQIVDAYIAAMRQRGRRAESIRNVQQRTRAFLLRYGSKQAQGVSRSDMDAFGVSQGWSPATAWAHLSTIAATFRYAAARGVIAEYTLGTFERPITDQERPKIMPPCDVAKLLHAISAFAPKYRAAAALAFFAGVRPNGELSRLRWEDVRLDSVPPVLVIDGKAAKRRSCRSVDITPNLAEWLSLDAGEGVGLVMDNYDAYRHVVQRCAAGAGVEVPENAGRHAYATYGMIAYGMERTAQALGHPDTGLLHRVYRGAPTGEAAEYFSILPE